MQHRYDFVYLFDVKDGNPNGDPDAGNLPRIDPETGQGLVTDVCLKRKIRNFVGLVKEEQPPFEIYVKEKAVLNQQHQRAYSALEIDPKNRAKGAAKKDKAASKAEEDRKLTRWMCNNFFDIRAFGAVMTTEVNCGQVRGPIQFGFARSIDPIISQEHAVTRCAVTTEKEAEKQSGDNRTMGRKFTVPYGLYRVHGFINPHLASQTGFDESGDDLELFWKALEHMFEHDRSASRGEMSPQGLIVFKHESKLGNAPAHKLFERVTITRANVDELATRSAKDYTVNLDESDLPEGITIEKRI
ncbi:type I-C CRISPR-associated protein Cas7/Csd2 [Thalassoroseus pseudoceratinae]|uniref:type I-C CRISPR-associated protein Cas7/Csd2 n=1 Tax=Thalassoroseus pseudoceratinae TaxID=2713176 RepID=UPI0014214AF6|nr:type I-C CRISPR-associated protein Cas7/Csd2 [Thalassoroseus pseudoceratinae]